MHFVLCVRPNIADKVIVDNTNPELTSIVLLDLLKENDAILNNRLENTNSSTEYGIHQDQLHNAGNVPQNQSLRNNSMINAFILSLIAIWGIYMIYRNGTLLYLY